MEILNGIDMEGTARFKPLIVKETFMAGVYTPAEREAVLASDDPARQAASFFSAKEAVSKALGRGLYGMLPKEIEIFHGASGRPCVRLLGRSAERYGCYCLSLSVSYKDGYVVTSCIAYRA